MPRPRHDRLSADDEQHLAQAILALELEVCGLLEAVPPCRAALRADPDRREPTRHAAVARLGAAVAVARACWPPPAGLAEIERVWQHAEALRWRLALSAEHVARSEARRHASPRVPREDLEQEGLLGLLAAATRFEPGHGVRFCAYARWWVRAQLVAVTRVAEVFRISSNAKELHRNAQKLLQRDRHDGLLRPHSAVAGELGVAPQRLHDVLTAVAARRAEAAEDHDDHAVVAGLPDLAARSPEQLAVDADLARRVQVVINASFRDRERHILAQRYTGGGVSVAAIAAALSLSAERVRQLEQHCLVTLRGMFDDELDV